MLNKSRAALAAVLAIGLSGSMVASFVGPAAAAGQICYFGECGPNTAPASTEEAPARQQGNVIGTHGNWKAVILGDGALIVDQFENNAKVGVLIYPEGKVGLMLTHPEWHLTKGQVVAMSIEIDGREFQGRAVVASENTLNVDSIGKELAKAFYTGRSGRIVVGQYEFEMTNLANAAAAIDDVLRYRRQTAER